MNSIFEQEITDRYAIYNGDCCEVMRDIPEESIHLTVYSPPFGGLYSYSSSDRDLSNCTSPDQFFEHYGYVAEQIERITMPGRISCVHCMEVPKTGGKGYYDLPGDIIRLHEKLGFVFWGRHCVWKEPLAVRLRTMSKGLAHKQIVDDSTFVDVATADYLLIFRKKGENQIPVTHKTGLHSYAGEKQMPAELLRFRGHAGKQTENRFSHWIWRQYASAFWDDVRLNRVLPFKASKEDDDEKHVHPLQLDVIERCVVLRSNPGETVLTPFMGVGSEVYGALLNGRNAIGIELKRSYYKQAKKNVKKALEAQDDQTEMNFHEVEA